MKQGMRRKAMLDGPVKRRLLFVCVENSCRSQIAEGFARALGADAFSAGSKPSGKVNETAVALMREKGISLTSHRSKSIQELPPGKWGCVVTMGCGDACSHVPAKKRVDWAIPDPKGLPLDEFRRVLDIIAAKVRALVGEKETETSV